jgi:hypothetical protein
MRSTSQWFAFGRIGDRLAVMREVVDFAGARINIHYYWITRLFTAEIKNDLNPVDQKNGNLHCDYRGRLYDRMHLSVGKARPFYLYAPARNKKNTCERAAAI